MESGYLTPNSFCRLTGCQRDPRDRGVIIIFFLHHCNPLGILKILGNSARFSERWNFGGEAIFRVGFDDDILSSGLHGMTI